jgi:glycosyl transferase family 2
MTAVGENTGGSGAPDVSVVFPCLNEEEAVSDCVTAALTALAAASIPAEVIVVDNGSTDRSAELASAAGARVIAEPRPGYGRALRTGFDHAEGRVVVMADADGTYDLDRLAELVRPVLDDEADMALATRLEGTTGETMPFLHRYVGTPVITFLTSRACGRKVTSDSQTGYRAFKRDRVADLALAGDGMELASEMLIKASRAEFRVQEMSFLYAERIGESKLNTWSDGWRHLMLIFLLAPDLLLIGPGIVLTALGGLAILLSFAQPEGIEVGSLRWQPVFFAGIAVVMGVQALLAGVFLANNSPVAKVGTRRFRFIDADRLPQRALAAGIGLIALGLAIDAGLFIAWLRDVGSIPTTGVGFGFAALAQTSLILGGTLALLGVVLRFVRKGAVEHSSPVDAVKADAGR